MAISVSEKINATKEQVWSVVTDIEKAKDRIECIKDIKVLERSETGIVGLKWKETRVMFGKEATETIWITQAIENDFYEIRAENCGCIYLSTVKISETTNGVELSMSFNAKPQTLVARLMAPMMFFMSGAIKKAYKKDLADIKNYFSFPHA